MKRVSFLTCLLVGLSLTYGWSQTSILINGDFSDGIGRPADWEIRTGSAAEPAGTVEFDETDYYIAAPSIKLSNVALEQYTCIWQLVEVEPGTIYRLQGWVKGTLEDAGTGLGIRLAIADAEEGNVVAVSRVDVVGEEWSFVTLSFKTGEERSVRVLAYLHQCVGSAWFDHLELVKD